MKTNQFLAIVLIVTSLIGGCKKNNPDSVTDQSNVTRQINQASTQTDWISSASIDGISNALIQGPVKNHIQPKNFVAGVDNRYFPLVPGDTLFYRNKIIEDGETTVEDIYVAITHDIRVILGVKCMVVHDFVKDHTTRKLLEDTYDYYAQDHAGNVWYFGEYTKSYDPDGSVSTEGTFIAGVDGAKPGIIMPHNPHYRHPYRQEYYVGHAEDQGVNLSTRNTVKIGYGTFYNCLKTAEYTVLEPGVIENKWYAPGIGLIQTNVTIGGNEHEELLRISHE